MRFPRKLLALPVIAVLCVSCASTDSIEDIEPGERPADESDEAGLWMQLDRAEDALRTSGRVVQDPELNAYVKGILCRLAPEFCEDLRTYVVRQAIFNASMAPNGTMSVSTGLILRAQNEAQLAYVLGHELAHYRHRHTLKYWQDLRAKTNALVFFQLATAAAGVGIVGDLAGFGVGASILSFSRDQEREADASGFEMMVKAGYDPGEAANIWRGLIEERDASEEPKELIFFSTHPTTEERAETLSEMAAAIEGGPGLTARERYIDETSRFRAVWLKDELRQRAFDRTEVVISQHLGAGYKLGELHFFMGELHRLRHDEDDEEKAVAAYEAAHRTGEAPPETYRSLGLTYWALDRSELARQAFEKYLLEQPEADDRLMIESYIQQIK